MVNSKKDWQSYQDLTGFKNLSGLFYQQLFNPIGVVYVSPGLRQRRYPGKGQVFLSTLKGLCPVLTQPFQGCLDMCRFPRVAATPQPWAGICNPFGVGLHICPKSSRPNETLQTTKNPQSLWQCGFWLYIECIGLYDWRRERDSNPRWEIKPILP